MFSAVFKCFSAVFLNFLALLRSLAGSLSVSLAETLFQPRCVCGTCCKIDCTDFVTCLMTARCHSAHHCGAKPFVLCNYFTDPVVESLDKGAASKLHSCPSAQLVFLNMIPRCLACLRAPSCGLLIVCVAFVFRQLNNMHTQQYEPPAATCSLTIWCVFC